MREFLKFHQFGSMVHRTVTISNRDLPTTSICECRSIIEILARRDEKAGAI